MKKEVIRYQYDLIKNILSTALPISLSAFIGFVALLVNYQILSTSNVYYLYWLALYAPFNYFLIALYEALKASSIFLASKTGAKKMIPEQMRIMISLFAIACGIVIFGGTLFLIFGFHHQEMYFYYFCTAMIFSSFFVIWFYIITSFYYGLQYKNFSVFLSIIAAVINCIATYVLCVKYQLGIFSYVLSNFLSYGITSFLSFIYFIQQSRYSDLGFTRLVNDSSSWWIFKKKKCCFFRVESFEKNLCFSEHNLKLLITRCDLLHGLKLLRSVGFPVWGSYFIIFISLLLTNHMLGDFGQNMISAYGLVYRIQSFILLPAIAFGTALAVLINQYQVRHQLILVKDIFKSGMFLSIFLYVFIAVFCFMCKHFLMRCMTNNLLIVHFGEEYLKYCSLSYSMLGPIIVYGVLLEQRGFGNKNLCIQGIYFTILIFLGWYATEILHNYHYFYFFIGADNLIIFLLVCFMIVTLDLKQLGE